MFTLTKQDSIVIALTLGIMLSVPLLIPALYTTTEITVLNEVASQAPGNLVRHLPKSTDNSDVGSQSREPGRDCGLYYGSSI